MERFLHAITTLPAVPMTILLGVVVGYWIFSLVTGAHVDGGDALTGGVKAAGEALEHAGDLFSVDHAGEGLADAVAADPHAEHDLTDAGLFAFLGLDRVPVTITFSTAILIAWLVSVLAALQLEPEALLLKLGLLAGASVVGLFGAALVLRPLGRALSASKPARRRDVLGQICVITSGHVDAKFGTASLEDGGAGLNVHVFCAKPNTLKKGDRAILVHFDVAKETYEIEPVDWLLPQELEALNDPTRAAQVLIGRVRRR